MLSVVTYCIVGLEQDILFQERKQRQRADDRKSNLTDRRFYLACNLLVLPQDFVLNGMKNIHMSWQLGERIFNCCSWKSRIDNSKCHFLSHCLKKSHITKFLKHDSCMCVTN